MTMRRNPARGAAQRGESALLLFGTSVMARAVNGAARRELVACGAPTGQLAVARRLVARVDLRIFAGEVPREPLDKVDRAVLAAGAADRDRQVAAVGARVARESSAPGSRRCRANILLTCGWRSRYSTTAASRPVRRARPGSQYGFGRLRTSNTKSASPGTPCWKANDSNRIDMRPSARAPTRSADQLAQLVHAGARGVDDQIGRIGDRLSSRRS